MFVVGVLISIVFYFVLMFLSVNLLGLLVGGFLEHPEITYNLIHKKSGVQPLLFFTAAAGE